jgi:hypothetical protein
MTGSAATGNRLSIAGFPTPADFFFEVVRVGPYDGHAALDAPGRLASQAQRSEMSPTSPAVADPCWK